MVPIPSLEIIPASIVTDGDRVERAAFEVNVILGEYSLPEKLNYTVSYVSMTKRKLNLKLDFEYPLYVSTEEEVEELELIFNGGNLFVSQAGMLLELPTFREITFRRRSLRALGIEDEDTLDDRMNKYLLIMTPIPKQFPKEKAIVAAIEAIAQAADVTKDIIIVNLLANLGLSLPLQEMWAMINFQQLIMFMPLMDVDLPINAAEFFGRILRIANFNLVDFNDPVNKFLKLEQTEPLSDNFNDVGFESRYIINNMGALFFFFLLYPAFFLVERVLSGCTNCSHCCRKIHMNLRRSL